MNSLRQKFRGLLMLVLAVSGCDDKSSEVEWHDAGLSPADAAQGDFEREPLDTSSETSSSPFDASSDDALIDTTTARLLNLIVVVQDFGIFAESAELPNAPASSEAWQRTLTSDPSTLPLVLRPLAKYAENIAMFAGLGMHVGINQYTEDPTIMLAGYSPWRPPGSKAGDPIRSPGPSVDWLVGSANVLPNRPSALVITGNLKGSTFDTDGRLIRSLGLKETSASLKAGGCQVSDSQVPSTAGLADWMTSAIPLVTEALKCHYTRVVTMNLPLVSTDEVQYGADLAQNYAQRINNSGTIGENARRVMRDYNQFNAQQVARLIGALSSAKVDGGSLLNNTLVLWLGREGQPDHATSPFYAILLSNNKSIHGGRYVRPAQGNANAPGIMGPPHNQLLTSVANLFGLDLKGVGQSSLDLPNGVKLDLTGSLQTF